IPSMSIRWRWSRGIVLPVALAAVLFAPLTASGQEPSLEIVEVTHAPDGLITVSLARTADGLDPLSVTALLDGAPIEVKAVDESRPDPTSVVIAMDTSGSMQGAPMASAQA